MAYDDRMVRGSLSKNHRRTSLQHVEARRLYIFAMSSRVLLSSLFSFSRFTYKYEVLCLHVIMPADLNQ